MRIVSFVFVPLLGCSAWQSLSPVFKPREKPTPLALSSSSESNISTTTDDLMVTVREGIVEAGGSLQDWEESVAVVATALATCDDAERLLADATRWSAWARAGKLARKYIKPDSDVNAESLQVALDWLQTGPLKFTTEQVADAARQYPALYLLDPAAKYKKVLGVAPRQFRDSLPDLITEDYSVLQFQYNCDNDCISECGACWVTFQNRC